MYHKTIELRPLEQSTTTTATMVRGTFLPSTSLAKPWNDFYIVANQHRSKTKAIVELVTDHPLGVNQTSTLMQCSRQDLEPWCGGRATQGDEKISPLCSSPLPPCMDSLDGPKNEEFTPSGRPVIQVVRRRNRSKSYANHPPGGGSLDLQKRRYTTTPRSY